MTIHAPKFVPHGRLELVFKSDCDCGPGEVCAMPEDLIDGGMPTCSKCGEDLVYFGGLVYETVDEEDLSLPQGDL